jgi:hypothetical protein
LLALERKISVTRFITLIDAAVPFVPEYASVPRGYVGAAGRRILPPNY